MRDIRFYLAEQQTLLLGLTTENGDCHHCGSSGLFIRFGDLINDTKAPVYLYFILSHGRVEITKKHNTHPFPSILNNSWKLNANIEFSSHSVDV